MRIIAYLLILIFAIAMCIVTGSCSSQESKSPSLKQSLRDQNDSMQLVLERLSHEHGYLKGYYRGLRKDDIDVFKVIDSLEFTKFQVK